MFDDPQSLALEKVVEGLASFLWKKVTEALSPNDRRVEEHTRRFLLETAAEAARAVKEFERLIKERGASTEVQLAKLFDEQLAIRSYLAYLREAERSRTQGRIRMLASAFAGTFSPDLSEERKERAYRIALQLEPSDVPFLREYGRGPGDMGGEAERRRMLIVHNQVSYTALLSLGCLLSDSDPAGGERDLSGDWFRIGGLPHRTMLGADVLKLLETFPGDRKPDESETA